MVKLSNPLAFSRGPVTIITTFVYLAIIVILLIVDRSVPPPPKNPVPYAGINLTEAWQDLQTLTSSYHPFNSRQNAVVQKWLLSRIDSILKSNKSPADQAYVFDDTSSNLTFVAVFDPSGGLIGPSVYSESTNVVVYIPGTNDDPAEWWKDARGKPSSNNAVLVNAHYDSVSTGYGATDDGVGVVSLLQLIRYFTTSGHKPNNGVVLLFNNGEEDVLNGARLFSQHPMSKVVSSFLNLEGAGAGGRAAVFRTTDRAVTMAYAASPYPWGTSLSADGFQRGLVKSQTDYSVFNGNLGLRGLDVAFVGPRARYHTNQDDSRHTGRASLWNMLSTAVATTKQLTEHALTDDTASEYPNVGWFDFFGRRFAVFELHTIFALSISLLVAGPILLLLVLLTLYKVDKLYLWSGSRRFHSLQGDEIVPINGWRGFFRFPLIFLISCAAPVALAYLLTKQNEFIVHSSQWAVWTMMISSFVFVAWFLCRAGDYARPSALTRAYGLSWLWVGWWAILVAITVLEERLHLASSYVVLIYAASVWLATFVSYLELFSLPKKSKYCLGKFGEDGPFSRDQSTTRSQRSRPTSSHGDEPRANEEEEDDDDGATETSGLLRGRKKNAFRKYTRPSEDEEQVEDNSKLDHKDEPEEQEWSKSLWSWMWIIQLIILVPVNLVLFGQVSLFLTEGLHQTGQDGSSVFVIYLALAVFTIILFSPLVPILHRFSWTVPMFLLLVLIGTIAYNLVAFPFSSQSRLKMFFQQEFDLDNGNNTVSLLGAAPYVEEAVKNLPSAAGQDLVCIDQDSATRRQKCSWTGIRPRIVDAGQASTAKKSYKPWLSFNVTQATNATHGFDAQFSLSGVNTRACKIEFDSPISNFHVIGQGPQDKRFPTVQKDGGRVLMLWSRTWDRTWTVNVKWEEQEERVPWTGKVTCLWADVNQVGVIPAFDEALHYSPDWVAITKASQGLLEGYKRFSI